MKTIPNGRVELYMVNIDHKHKYTDDEIVNIMHTMLGYGFTEDWDYLEQCATSEKVKDWCRQRWHSAYRAEVIEAFD